MPPPLGGSSPTSFRELAGAEVRPLSVGWDNTVFAVDERWAFRFPRRAIAIAGIEREIAVLPHLASRLPVPIPAPHFIGRPVASFPWPFFGAPLLPGAEVDGEVDGAARERLAPALGAFVRVLHDTPSPAELPHDPMRRVDMARRVPFGEQRLAELHAAGLVAPYDALRRVLDAARDLPPSPRSVLVHGDLHVRHVLVDATREPPLCGVIDWGDVCLGDPAMDVAIAWNLFAPPAREAFFAAYGPIEPDQVARARVVALFLSATLALYGAAADMSALRDESLAGLVRIVAQPRW